MAPCPRILNPPFNVPEGAHHVFQVAENILEKGQPFKSLDQGMALTHTRGPSMTFPTPPPVYEQVQRIGRS